jgi:hypothetical protein
MTRSNLGRPPRGCKGALHKETVTRDLENYFAGLFQSP